VVIKYKVLILTTFLVIVADQGSKIYIDHAFPLEEGRKIVAVVPNYINITHVRNPGAAFGMLAGSNKKFRGPFFLATSILATTIILLVLYRLPPGKSSTAFFLSLILGGGGHQVTVVFDGTASGNLHESRQRRKGIGIVFSSHGETADDLIVRMVTGLREGAVVVSSDRELSRSIEKLGATPIASPEFMEKLENALERDPMGNGDAWEESEDIPARKGSQKKLSKKDRRARKKLDQL